MSRSATALLLYSQLLGMANFSQNTLPEAKQKDRDVKARSKLESFHVCQDWFERDEPGARPLCSMQNKDVSHGISLCNCIGRERNC